jgi:hypothetical protein
MKFKFTGPTIALAAVALFTGCSSTTPVMTPAQLQTKVSTGVRIGLDVVPTAAPDIAVARDLICQEASRSNVDPQAIVKDLAAAGLTNQTSKLIIDGALFAYEGVYTLIGTTNQAVMQPYVQATCSGMTDALPVAGKPMLRRSSAILPPHLGR